MSTTDARGALLNWTPARVPVRRVLAGATIRLEPLDPRRHGGDLYCAAQGSGADPRLWDYMAVGPFAGEDAFTAWLDQCAGTNDPLFFAPVDQLSGRAEGMASYMRIVPRDGVIEIGSIWFGSALRRTRQATEAIFLLMRHVFRDLGYRRLEWKCDALNERSRRTAQRFGFRYEGLFRQHMVVKGRNRDTAWFAMLDHEWPHIEAAFERWLAPENFDAAGGQRQPLCVR